MSKMSMTIISKYCPWKGQTEKVISGNIWVKDETSHFDDRIKLNWQKLFYIHRNHTKCKYTENDTTFF